MEVMSSRREPISVACRKSVETIGELGRSACIYLALRSALEPLLALVLIFVLSPIWILVAVAVRVSGPGPVLFQQVRTGLKGKPFCIWKFRTMIEDAEKNGVAWSAENDPRITRIGRFLRATHLDELPQLINIFRGEMSFIGPRPERPEFYERLTKVIPDFPLRLTVKPGITGLAQISLGYVSSVEASREKLRFDLIYIRSVSLRTDLRILLKTVAVFLRPRAGDR